MVFHDGHKIILFQNTLQAGSSSSLTKWHMWVPFVIVWMCVGYLLPFCFFYTDVLQTASMLQIVSGLTGGPSARFLGVEVLNGKFRLENIMKKLLKMSYEVDEIYSVKEELCVIGLVYSICIFMVLVMCLYHDHPAIFKFHT
jgi:hypothetical protein